jgi:hypothetical protein
VASIVPEARSDSVGEPYSLIHRADGREYQSPIVRVAVSPIVGQPSSTVVVRATGIRSLTYHASAVTIHGVKKHRSIAVDTLPLIVSLKVSKNREKHGSNFMVKQMMLLLI